MIGIVRNEALAGKIIQGAWIYNDKLKDIGFDVLEKHRFTCSKCGIKSVRSDKHRHAMMTPINLNHAGLAATRLKGAECYCPFCVCAIATNWSVVGEVVEVDGEAERKPPAGFLIYMPYKSQVEINRLATFTVAYLQRPREHPLHSVATDIALAMGGLAEEAKKIPIYDGNDGDFVKALSRLPEEYYQQRDQIIGALRWWPDMDYWAEYGRYIYGANLRAFESKFKLDKKIAAFV